VAHESDIKTQHWGPSLEGQAREGKGAVPTAVPSWDLMWGVDSKQYRCFSLRVHTIFFSGNYVNSETVIVIKYSMFFLDKSSLNP
jgi:hypothetical protein